MDGNGLGVRLMAAVRAGDADAVRALLDAGADPDTEVDGLSALCVALAAYDEAVTEALVRAGADPDRVLPDGTTLLWRAVDGGSPAVFVDLLGSDARERLPEAARERLLALARGWYETGAAEELRRRTGARGPAVMARVQEDAYHWVEEISLGGRVVRAGHGAVLTWLEWAFRVLTPVDELVARAVRQRDEDHVDWTTARWILVQRRSDETWSAVVAHRHHPDPWYRRFVTDYVRMRSLVDPGHRYYRKREGELLAAWAAEETDVDMLAEVLTALAEYEHPGQEAVGLRHAGHPDPRVRREVPCLLSDDDGDPRSPTAKDAMLALMSDPDAEVRLYASSAAMDGDELRAQATDALLLLTRSPVVPARHGAAVKLAASRDRTPAVADALFALLDEDEQLVRLEAAWGLARRDDPRTEEAYERVGPLGPGFEHDHRAHALGEWRQRRSEEAAGCGPPPVRR
ncbi:ankyrin repeat domain-containing protein [Streptomyces sp. G5(2025)]|uniref:ankyrin repeat domain-containing protein n=1 Tax=Streptomyces sp. G5(2025) TaxID=3406628 RepID=UPI003C1C7D29